MLSRSRKVALFAAIATMAQLASGYYTWTFFPTRNAPGIPARFDLSALPGKTVSYFISEQGPSKFMPGDNFAKLISQIQAAAATWNNVASSDLRVAFGGLSSVGSATQSLPGIDVVFDDDMPPGLEAYTRPVFGANANGFVPIQRAAIHLRSDLTVKQQASYTDSYFLTVVHEFGHALGLQQTQGMLLTDSWYWDTSDATRAWAKRYFERVKKMPNSGHAGDYSAITTYLNAVKATGSDNPEKVIAYLKSVKINDMFAQGGYIRPDGRMVHDMHLVQVKTPSESKQTWDYFKLVERIPGEQAFTTKEESKCASWK